MYPFAIAQKYQILLLEVWNNLQHLIEQSLEFTIFLIHPFQRHNINLNSLIFPNSRIWQLSSERANHFVTDRKLERSIESNENSFLRAGRQAGRPASSTDNRVSINEGCFVGHRVRVISVSDRSPSVILAPTWQPNSRCAAPDWLIYPFLVYILRRFRMKILHTLLCIYAYTRTHTVSTGTNGNPRAIQRPLVIKLFRLPGLGR